MNLLFVIFFYETNKLCWLIAKYKKKNELNRHFICRTQPKILQRGKKLASFSLFVKKKNDRKVRKTIVQQNNKK